MATRFYFPSSGSTVTPSAWAGGWSGTAGAVGPLPLVTTKTSTAMADATVTPSTGAGNHAVGRWVSAPLEAQTISGTISGVVRAVESADAMAAVVAIAIRVIKPDMTERGVLLSRKHSDIYSTRPPEISYTTPSTRRFMDANEATSITLASVSAEEGDRLVVELGGSCAGANGSRTATLRYGDTGDDFAHSDDLTTDLAPWVEFSDDITFVPSFTPETNDEGYEFDGLLNPDGGDVTIFSAYSTGADTSVYNADLWGGGGPLLDWTGIAWHDSGGTTQHTSTTNGRCVAITKRHCISTHHGGDPTNATLTFIKADGTRVTRDIINATNVGNLGGGQISGGGQQHTLYYLDADLPNDIATYPIFADALADLTGVPFVKLRKSTSGDGGKACVADFNLFEWGIYNNTPAYVINTIRMLELIYPADATRALYYEASISGDSGSPVFLVYGDQLIYVSNVTGGSTGDGGATSGHDSTQPMASWHMGLIKKACIDLDVDTTGYMPTWWGAENNKTVKATARRRKR